MSRIPRETVWAQYSFLEKAICPVCEKNPIYLHAKRGEYGDWHRGHIQAASRGGPDTLVNLLPICSQCNGNSTKHIIDYSIEIGKQNNAATRIIRYRENLFSNGYNPTCEAVNRTTHTSCNSRKTSIQSRYCDKHHSELVCVPMDCN